MKRKRGRETLLCPHPNSNLIKSTALLVLITTVVYCCQNSRLQDRK